MKRSPSVLRTWQEAPPREDLPTCYEERNPAAPWLRAKELEFDDAEDREEATAWVRSGVCARALADCQRRCGPVEVIQPAGDAAPVEDPFTYTLPIREQLARAIAACTSPLASTEKP